MVLNHIVKRNLNITELVYLSTSIRFLFFDTDIQYKHILMYPLNNKPINQISLKKNYTLVNSIYFILFHFIISTEIAHWFCILLAPERVEDFELKRANITSMNQHIIFKRTSLMAHILIPLHPTSILLLKQNQFPPIISWITICLDCLIRKNSEQSIHICVISVVIQLLIQLYKLCQH